MKQRNSGITLIALIITIIILLILAAVSISTLTESRLFNKAKLAEQNQKNAQIKEEIILGDYENQINELGDISSSRDENSSTGSKTKLWEFNPEATDANNGETVGTIILPDLIDNYDAISVTGQMKDNTGLYYASQSILILKENYYLASDLQEYNFVINSYLDRYISFGFKTNEKLNKTELIIAYVKMERLVNVYGINF